MSGSGRTGDGRSRLGSVLSGLAVAVGCVLFLGGFAWGAVVYKPYTVPTQSMTPTVHSGDRVLAERIDGGEVRRGDVVVFADPAWGDMPMVKRVVGIGGDKITCCGADGRLRVNGKPLDEPYLRNKDRASTEDFTAEVPEGQLFLLGDDRTSSLDSRVHLEGAGKGSVPRDAVQARVDAIAWPMNGMVERPRAFAGLPGGISSPGPIQLQLRAVIVGMVLILGGAAYGPVETLLTRSARKGRERQPAGAH